MTSFVTFPFCFDRFNRSPVNLSARFDARIVVSVSVLIILVVSVLAVVLILVLILVIHGFPPMFSV